ncbi:vesicle transport V-snare protein [Pseudovirgaria hyperparasitica]|uniref:Vesicle transport V-snare protein n=1 Tax=Pseudovirgaria hyperparasitica TaxID=470096 RepID=A0A6A6WIR9_9PEZI|nr:vesicle transport V-snare protein [Pseudovirgaria hyperparasitica]KAF2762219.1 vesicle transport V-snare protein [Pseudovirgaria hyperparasitica]
MSNILDSEIGSERLSGYEGDLKLVQADINQKLEEIPELAGEPRKAAVTQAERALEEAAELIAQMDLERAELPGPMKSKVAQRLRGYRSDVDAAKRKLKSFTDDRRALFGSRYTDNPTTDDQLEQRQQLLSGTERLERSSGRLRDSQRIALETEDIGRNTLADLHVQRSQIEHTRTVLDESEGYTDRSIKTLRGMARR